MDNDGGVEEGLVYRGRKKGGRVNAGGTLTMAQYNEDQVVSLQCNQDGPKKVVELTFADRPDSIGAELGELFHVLDPAVDSLGNPSILFLDPTGKVVRAIPEAR